MHPALPKLTNAPVFATVCLLFAAALFSACRESDSPAYASENPASRTTNASAQNMSKADHENHSDAHASHSADERARLQQELSPLQFQVVCNEATEPPFRNAYWDNKEPGIYVDVVSGEPLFSSVDKFDSGTGWPSFSRPLQEGEIINRTDKSHGMVRTEVRSRSGKAHLGHLFPDGPGPSGLRYCINSASLRFIPVADLEKEGYGDYLKLFNGN